MTARHARAHDAATRRVCMVLAAAALLAAMCEPSFAARKSRKPADSAPIQRSDAARVPPSDPRGTSRNPFGPGRNLPYPDRPYGDPGRW